METQTTMEIPLQSRLSRPTNHSTLPQPTPTYGYHNTFHTHAQLPLGAPPSYARATDWHTLRHLQEKAQTEAAVADSTPRPPSYSCSVSSSGVLGMKQELSSPFSVAARRVWFEAFAVLEGTQLSMYRAKHPSLLSKNKTPTAGRFLRSYTLQHAEVGIASDFRKTALIPKSPFAHLIPSSARARLYETDPHLFEPVREHVLRLRLETEQFLLCASTAESMLSWLELLCAAIDISAPIEDRSEPRYRSLPRRSRRQRILDNSAQLAVAHVGMDSLSSLEAGRRIIAQQEQIIRHLYPNLAATSREPGSTQASSSPSPITPDPDVDDFDPEDVRFPTPHTPLRLSASEHLDASPASSPSSPTCPPNDTTTSTTTTSNQEEEAAKPTDHFAINATPNLRYRRRCAPVLLASSPRVSDIIFSNGTRMRINIKQHMLVEYTPHPPRYDAHSFARSPKRLSKLRQSIIHPASSAAAMQPAKHDGMQIPVRPTSPMRSTSDDISISSITFDQDGVSPIDSSGSLESAPDVITTTAAAAASTDQNTVSHPPLLPSAPRVKTGNRHHAPQHKVVELARKRTSEDVGIGEVALGVGVLV